MRRNLAVMAALFVAAVATSCGSTSGVGGAPNGGPDTTISTGPSTAGLEISGVAPGADPTVLVATAEAVPVGPGSCAVEVTPLVEYEADRIYLSLTVTVEMTQVLEIVDGGGFRTIEESTSTDGCDHTGPGHPRRPARPPCRDHPEPDGQLAGRCRRELPAVRAARV